MTTTKPVTTTLTTTRNTTGTPVHSLRMTAESIPLQPNMMHLLWETSLDSIARRIMQEHPLLHVTSTYHLANKDMLVVQFTHIANHNSHHHLPQEPEEMMNYIQKWEQIISENLKEVNTHIEQELQVFTPLLNVVQTMLTKQINANQHHYENKLMDWLRQYTSITNNYLRWHIEKFSSDLGYDLYDDETRPIDPESWMQHHLPPPTPNDLPF